LHTVNKGAASQSYGIQVAQLAGVPRAVIQLAKQKLQTLEKMKPEPRQADLFAQREDPHPAIKALETINPDQLSPKEALDFLYQLKTLTV
jgi:DNA mismatch repair protein MutS